jgi:hypothetical protein
VSEPSPNQIRKVLKFSQFRFKLIEFLRLPLNISEAALRGELERASPDVLRNYLAREEHEGILDYEDTMTMRVLGRDDLAIIK